MPINNFLKLNQKLNNKFGKEKSVYLKSRFINISSLLVFLLVAALSSCSTTSVKDRTWIDNEIINNSYKEFVGIAESYLEEKHFSGTILISKGQEIIFAKGYGLNDKKDKDSPGNTIHTTYEAGAITKQITAAAIMQLAESGDLYLSDPLSKYYPDYKYGNDITIEMLLANCSGLLDHLRMSYEYFPSEVARDIDMATTECRNEDVPRYVVIDYLYDAPLYAKPGTTFIESNTDYYILGTIVEKVSGMPFEEYVKKFIFDKAGMVCSNLEYQDTIAKGYDYKGKFYSIPKGLALGCDDLNTCVVDLFKWNYALSHGEIVTPESFIKMIQNNYGAHSDGLSYRQTGITDVFNAYNQYFTDQEVSLIVLCNEPISDNSATIIASSINRMFLEYIRKK